ncbi:hypothetical protein F4782DRAFT_521848 [Xylaria castorea]|nr:hypothetical protein F4782DRAFT_521848 [Xylaria castorea]
MSCGFSLAKHWSATCRASLFLPLLIPRKFATAHRMVGCGINAPKPRLAQGHVNGRNRRPYLLLLAPGRQESQETVR